MTAPAKTKRVDELRLLEAEAVHIIREVVAELERPVLLFSAGKDSIVLLRLAEKAFRPLPLPFPVMHVDTGHNFPEVIEFRDRRVTGEGHKLIVASVQESIDNGRVADPGRHASRNRAQTRAGGRRVRRGVRRCPPGRGAGPCQRADSELPRRVRPMGSARSAPGALVALQRPDQEGRAGAGVPAEQLDRDRHLALPRVGKP
jgi:hypothetical protein